MGANARYQRQPDSRIENKVNSKTRIFARFKNKLGLALVAGRQGIATTLLTGFCHGPFESRRRRGDVDMVRSGDGMGGGVRVVHLLNA